MLDRPHVHNFYNEATIDFAHSHLMSGTTSYDIPYGNSHVHSYRGVTTVNHAHVHYFSGVTGLEIPSPGGGHTYQYQGTSMAIPTIIIL